MYYKENTKDLFCSRDRADGMVNVNSKKCTRERCKTQPIYLCEGKTKAPYSEERPKPQILVLTSTSTVCCVNMSSADD
jgi:hypothetical protein